MSNRFNPENVQMFIALENTGCFSTSFLVKEFFDLELKDGKVSYPQQSFGLDRVDLFTVSEVDLIRFCKEVYSGIGNHCFANEAIQNLHILIGKLAYFVEKKGG